MRRYCNGAPPPLRAAICWTRYEVPRSNAPMSSTRSPLNDRELMRSVMRLHAGVLDLVGGILGGALVFAMTAWLLIKGGPTVGPHLQLLSQYFYGYSVSWLGAAVGFLYGALIGTVVGWTIGAVYNVVAGLRP